ncbi:hypothetical protein niasHT_036086 [Heterodera trifolii]|uniref:polynucleotide adenylyltransferase n=1 Tax=Heterodera trifolii TaxID=157864 RepID=A0ABD2I0E5_9BILA
MSAVELIKRFSVLFPLGKLNMVWPTVRKCRNQKKVMEWIKLSDKQNHGQTATAYHDAEAALLAKLYVDFFNNNEIFDPTRRTKSNEIYNKIKRMDIFSMAAIWLINNLVEELIIFAETFFGKMDAKDNTIDELWSEWANALRHMEKAENLEHKFCSIHKMATFTMNILWLCASKTEWLDILAMLHKKRWSELTFISVPIETKFLSNNFECSVEETAQLMAMARAKPNYELIHALTLYRLIRRLNPFKSLFSGTEAQIDAMKSRLFIMLDSANEFGTLEKAFPEQLHIDAFCLSHRIELYTDILFQRTSSERAKVAEVRLATTMLYRYFKSCFEIKLNKGQLLQVNVTRAALSTVRNKVYPNFDRMEGLCWLMFLMPLIADEDEKNGDDTGGGFVLPTEPSVLNCVMSDGKLPEFAPYWTLVHLFHYEWLSAEQQVGIPYGRLFTQMKNDGILTRMKRLLGDTWFELLCTMYPDVCKYTINVFDDHVTLKTLYIHAIFSTTTTDSDLQWLNLKLAADMIVFVHWFDAEAKGPKMCTFWHTKRAQLRQQYDQLFDLSLTDGQALGQAARAFEQQWHELKHFLITHRHSDQELLMRDVTRKLNKRLESEWDRVEKAGGGGKKQQHHQRRHNSVISGEIREFLNQLHADQLKLLLSQQQRKDNDNDNTDEQKQTDGEAKQNNELIDKIVKQIESGITMVAQIRPLLDDFVGENQVDNIFKILGIPDILEGSNDALLLVDTEREENVESNKKSTTKKKKPKKKQLNTEETGGEEADKTATSDKLSQKEEQLTTDKQPINDDGDGIIETNRHKKAQKNKSLDYRKSSNNDTFAKTIKVNKLSAKRAKAADKVVENDQNDKMSSNISGIKSVIVNIGKTPNDSEENTLFSKLTEKNTDKMTQQQDKMSTKANVRTTKSKNSSNKTGEIETKNDASKSVKIYKIADVKEDAFLLDHYQMLLTNPNEFSNEKQRNLFELSIYSNESWHRFLAHRHFANIAIQFWHSKTNFLVEKWTEIENKQIINEKDEQLKMELHEMLSNFSTDYKRNFENFGWKIFGEILYRNWLARTLLSNARLSEEWNKLNKDSQTKAITVIFAAENENRKSKDGKRKNVLKYMEKWSKTLEQLRLDKGIFDDFVKKKYLIGQMPAYWRAHIEYIQEINCDIMSNFPEALENILNTNGHDTLSKAHEIKVHFNKIRTIVQEWSNGQSDLLLGGSMILGAFTMDSDVDTICVSPEHIQADQFFGTVSCHQKFAEECRNDGSLFCQLCFHPEIHSLQRIQSNWVPLIRLKVINFDHEIDIVFASIPGEKQIHFNDDHNYDNDGDQWQQNILPKIEEMIEKLGNQIETVDEEIKMQKNDNKNDQSVLINTKEQMLRSLRSLAGFHSNIRLLDMVTDKENFQKLLLTLKLWAKSHYIYNNALGFFNGTSLAILAAKIMLLYPDATVPFLLERFFLTYATWEWPIPVQIAEIRPNSSLNWNAWNEKQNGMGTYSKLTMPVITPGFPESNSTHLINHQTEKIIKMAINNALKLLHSSAENHKEKWSHLLAQHIKFNKKYSQHFTVTCVASDLNMFDEFCGFVVKRIRAQLAYLNNCTRGDVDFCHVILLNSCPPYITQKHIKISPKIFCKAWLVGVKEKDTEIQGKQRHDGEQLQQNDNNLKKELDEMIVKSYKHIVFDKWRRDDVKLNLAQQKIKKHFAKSIGTENWQQDFVNLESKYVDKLNAADLN